MKTTTISVNTDGSEITVSLTVHPSHDFDGKHEIKITRDGKAESVFSFCELQEVAIAVRKLIYGLK